MKLNKELKQRIDNYFDRISPSALYKLLVEKYGMKEGDNKATDMTEIDKCKMRK